MNDLLFFPREKAQHQNAQARVQSNDQSKTPRARVVLVGLRLRRVRFLRENWTDACRSGFVGSGFRFGFRRGDGVAQFLRVGDSHHHDVGFGLGVDIDQVPRAAIAANAEEAIGNLGLGLIDIEVRFAAKAQIPGQFEIGTDRMAVFQMEWNALSGRFRHRSVLELEAQQAPIRNV